MQKENANALLNFMISSLILALEELSTTPEADAFCNGEKNAYVECLEWLQHWEYAEAYGLDFDVERRFPL